MKKFLWIMLILTLASLSCFSNILSPAKEETPPPSETPTPTVTSDLADENTTPTRTPTREPSPTLSFTPTAANTQMPTPLPITLSEIFMIDARTGWGLAGQGAKGDQVVQTSDGGESWQTVFMMPDELLDAGATRFVGSFPDAQTAWLTPFGEDYVPAEIVLFQTADGGQTWQTFPPQPLNGAGEFYDVYLTALDANQAWALSQLTALGTGVNYAQQLFHTTDGGATWDAQTLILNGINGMTFIDSSLGMLASELASAYAPPISPIIYVTSDGGQTWDQLELPIPDANTYHHCQAITPFMYGTLTGGLLVHCYQDAFDTVFDPYYYATSNAAASWETYPLPPDAASLWMRDRMTGWAYGPEPALYQTTDGGITWLPLETPLSAEILSLSFVNLQDGWLTMAPPDGMTLYRTMDGGLSWQALEPVIDP